MSPKHLKITAFILCSTLFLASCTVKDQVKNKVLQKVDTQIQQELQESEPTLTDDQLLEDIQANDDVNIDQEFTKLDQELN